MQSILDSVGGIDQSLVNIHLLKEEEEFEVIKLMSSFASIVHKAKEESAPHLIAKYCFELAQSANGYYAHTKIRTDDASLMYTRTFLLSSIVSSLRQAMQLIGMHFVERM